MGLAAAVAAIPDRTESIIAARLDAARLAVEGRFFEAGEVLAKAVEGLGGLIASLDQLATR